MPQRLRIHRLVHFSLGALLWVTLCTCGYFGSYRAGQLAAQRDEFNALPTARVYDVSDIMADLPSPLRDRTYRELCAHLRAALPPEAWASDTATKCGVHPFGATHAVAVLQRGPAHDQIAAALEEFRRGRTQAELAQIH
jgi:hypothetical protein